jgi:hypothetical protein
MPLSILDGAGERTGVRRLYETLTAGSAEILRLHEASLSSTDVETRLRKGVQDAHSNGSDWAYYKEHFGDDSSGDVVYTKNGQDHMAPYDFDSSGDGASLPVIHTADAKKVMSRSTYEEVPEDDGAQYTSMLEAKVYSEVPMYERFISKGERDKADSGDFAGKGKSFPILKDSDVMAAVRSIGRAGPENYDKPTIRKNIIRIAKKKGFAGSLPKSWQAGGSKESRPVSRETIDSTKRLSLVESASTLETIRLVEAKADYEIKLIAPGKGSTAFYPAEVLRRDGPKVFRAGTHVYLNHPTAAEEAARPEGDVANLAGVLSSDAVYHESHAKGPGLFARMKVFADHAQMVEEKAPHVGMSIRAFGQQESGKTKDGVPVLKELTSAESVDVVTRAGAGGMILTEAARGAESHQEDSEMDADLKALQESNRKLLERALRADAREEAQRLLEGVTLPAAAKAHVIDTVMREAVPLKDGELDKTKLAEAIKAEAKRVGQMIRESTGLGDVRGMGTGLGETDPAKIREAQQRADEEERRLRESGTDAFTRLAGGNAEVGKLAANRGLRVIPTSGKVA